MHSPTPSKYGDPSAEADIDAPLDTVWQVMTETDTDRYPDWNPFAVRVECDGPPAVGSPVRRGTRWQRLSQVDGGPTRYETVEEFSGPLVPLAGPARVAEGFGRHARALKERAETLSRATG